MKPIDILDSGKSEKRLTLRLLASSLAALSNICLGDSGWLTAGKVTRIHSGHSATTILFSTEKQYSAGAGCDNTHGYMVTNDADSAKRIYATLMMAYSLGKPIAIYLTGDCSGGRPMVNAVQINDLDYF